MTSRLLKGLVSSGQAADLPPDTAAAFLLEDTLSYLLIPIKLRGAMWGVVGFCDMQSRRDFTKNEQSILNTGGQLIANAFLRNKMTTEIQAAYEVAQAASLAKSNFLSTMSHEMRTPLNAIIGMTKLGQIDATDKTSAFEKIEAASGHLLNVINDVLDMSKIEAGMLTLALETFELGHMIETVCVVNHTRVQEKQLTLVVNVAEDVPKIITADSHRMQQVLINLIGNAVKFTNEGTEVKLSVSLARRDADMCMIQFDVEDKGIGLSEQQQANLFESFVQAETHTARKYGGTGLGLAISKHLVGLMGGEIWVKSRPGEGATFSFTVSVRESDEGWLTFLSDDDDGELNLHGKRILLVEDLEIIREIVLSLLYDSGAEIVCAENGREAVRLYSDAPGSFDLILMDVHMPFLDGYQATRKIRALPHPAAGIVPIVAMTANVFRDDVERCMNAGMTAHLGKPLEFNVVKATLRKFIGGS
jgi:signal transduction histidine kinase/CheY-like chemotaxis protein